MQVSLAGIEHSAYVRFSLLALSSIFFLVDPFAALPTFLAVTAGADKHRRRVDGAQGVLTAFVVLTAFALAGQYIFKMFGITLPAFEIAGGIILLLIGLDMLEAQALADAGDGRREPRPPRPRKTRASCRWGSPCWPGRARLRA